MPESIDDIMRRIVALQLRANAINAKRDEALRSSIRTNVAGNYFLPAAPFEGSLLKTYNIPRNYAIQGVTNAPDTAIILAHGSPEGKYGIDPESPIAPAFRKLKEEKEPLKEESEKIFDSWKQWIQTLPSSQFIEAFGGKESKSSQAIKALGNLNEAIEVVGFTIDDFAKAMGGSTNAVRRLVNSACFAAGLTFDEAKKRFPNLETLISPSTDKPTSAVYLDVLGRSDSPYLKSYSDERFSPFYAITKDKTNLVTGPQGWNPEFWPHYQPEL